MTEVRFCNLCDRSVPEGEIQEGGALVVHDRVLCRECRSLMTRAAGGGRRGGGSWALALVALLGVVALAWEGRQERDRLLDEVAAVQVALERSADEAAMAREDLARELAEPRALLQDRLDGLEAALAADRDATAERLRTLESNLATLDRLTAELGTLQEKLALLEGESAVAGDRQRALRAAVEGLRDRMEALESRAQAAPPGQKPEAGEGGESFRPEVARLLRSLRADDPRERYDALEKLAARQDLRLLPHIYPLLADPYEFVRFLAAHTLGEWEARPAVPYLIEALLDEKPFVAEAAVGALRRLTGQDFGFDPGASAEARRRVHDAWQAWWEEHGEEFLAGGS